MPATWRGVVCAAINVVVVALVIATVGELDHGRHYNPTDSFYMVCVFGMMPALVAGAAIGAVAARVRRFRRSLIIAGSVALVVALGASFGYTDLIAVASVPTILMALWFEHETRNEQPGPLAPSAKGAVLAVLAACAIGALAVIDGARPDTILTVAIFGTLPAAIVGLGAGALAGAVAALRPAGRLAVLLPAVLAIAVGTVHLLDRDLLVPALAPTVIAIAMLERWTRPRELIPSARTGLRHRAESR